MGTNAVERPKLPPVAAAVLRAAPAKRRRRGKCSLLRAFERKGEQSGGNLRRLVRGRLTRRLEKSSPSGAIPPPNKAANEHIAGSWMTYQTTPWQTIRRQNSQNGAFTPAGAAT